MNTNRMIGRWSVRAAAMAIAIVIAGAAYISLRSYRLEQRDFLPEPPSPILSHPDAAGIAGLSVVSFSTSRGVTISGWFVPPRHRAAVLLLHGTSADRSALLWEARVLARAGFGVLAFDWPGYGLSAGTVDWGPGERDALAAALDWLVADRRVDPSRIGAFGFSDGGYILAQVAAADLRLRALVLAATPSDIVEQTRWEFRRYGPLSEIPANLALRRSGMPLGDRSPRQLVASIAPRPILFLGGTADRTVPEAMVRDLYHVAGEPKQLWIVPGAPHGRYDSVAPREYEAILVDFFSRSLLGAAAGPETARK